MNYNKSLLTLLTRLLNDEMELHKLGTEESDFAECYPVSVDVRKGDEEKSNFRALHAAAVRNGLSTLVAALPLQSADCTTGPGLDTLLTRPAAFMSWLRARAIRLAVPQLPANQLEWPLRAVPSAAVILQEPYFDDEGACGYMYESYTMRLLTGDDAHTCTCTPEGQYVQPDGVIRPAENDAEAEATRRAAAWTLCIATKDL